MAAYETHSRLAMADTLQRAREFFELHHGLRLTMQLGAQLRWRDESGATIALEAAPIKGGGTRLEIESQHHDELVLEFIHALPRPGLLDELRRRLRGG